MLRSPFACCILALYSFPAFAADDAKDEMAKLQGTWQIVQITAREKTVSGKELPKEFPRALQIKGDQIDYYFTDGKAKFTIDPKQSPKHLDLSLGKDLEPQKWIYELKGNELKLALRFEIKIFGEADTSRPPSFDCKDLNVVVFTLKRVPPFAVNGDREAHAEMKKLEGTWKIVSVESDRQLVPEGGGILPAAMKFTGDRIDGVPLSDPVQYAIDLSQKPKWMDTWPAKEKNGEKIMWIYELTGDDLKMAMTFDFKLFGGGEPDRSRPSSFETKGNKVIVVTMKREKKK